MRILVAIDGSAHGEVVVRAAAIILRHVEQPMIRLCTIVDASEARATYARTPGIEVPRATGWAGAGATYVGADPPSARTVEDRAQAFARLRDEVAHRLSHLASEHLASRSVEIHVEASEETDRAITAAADQFGADLIVLGTHGRTGVRRMVLGSVAQAAVRRSDIPALLVRDLPPASVDDDAPVNMVLPTDGSPRVRSSLVAVGALATALSGTVTVVRVMERPHMLLQSTLAAQRRAVEREVEEHVAELSAAGVRADGATLGGSPARTIANFARNRATEAILVPTHDRSEAGRIVFGSVADQLIDEAPCPVALIKARRQ
jgi:nucleotide-binding universal stress UspA family protein